MHFTARALWKDPHYFTDLKESEKWPESQDANLGNLLLSGNKFALVVFIDKVKVGLPLHLQSDLRFQNFKQPI
jgi:hypothetical protein